MRVDQSDLITVYHYVSIAQFDYRFAGKRTTQQLIAAICHPWSQVALSLVFFFIIDNHH